MKHRRLGFGLAGLLAAMVAAGMMQGCGSGPDLKAGGIRATKWQPGSYEHNLLRDVVNPFDPEELVRLAADSEKDPYRLTDLIHRAAAEKDVRFRYLVGQKNLRWVPAMDLAVSAYDYAVNGNPKSLDHILEIHARQAPGSDSDSLVTLSYLDEWDRTIAAYHAHFAKGTDGAGGDAKYAFLLKREYLFPQNYRKFKREEDAQDGRGDGKKRSN